MTEYRSMNPWTDDNSSVMEAFMSSDLSSLWPPPQSSSASTSVAPPVLNQESLQQRLQALIEGARESWTYAIFWQSSYDYSGASLLGWGDGYYKGEEDKAKNGGNRKTPQSAQEQENRKKVLRELNSLISGSADDAVDEEVTDTEWFFLVSMTQSFVNAGGLPGQALFSSNPVWVAGADRLAASPCDRARQGQVFGLQTIVCIPSANGVVELGSTEMIFQSSDLMHKVKVLFNFNNNPEMGSCKYQKNMERSGRRSLLSVVFLVLMLLVATEIGVGEGRTCESQSHKFKGACARATNCANVCKTEGFSGGHCRGFRRRCFCTKHC